ncbi:MAG: hypothetical protein KHW59_04095 [Clostridiales bacterium]|nr:hypothetical protein [Clostridiales bacterium]
MPQYFHFERLIQKYQSLFEALTFTEGYYNESGDFISNTPIKTELQGAIINFAENRVYRSEGTLSAQDKRLFLLEPLEEALRTSQVVHDGKVYSITDCTENAVFTGVYMYTLKYVSAFKEAYPKYDSTKDFRELEKRLDGVLTEEEEPAPVVDPFADVDRLEKRLDGILLDGEAME